MSAEFAGIIQKLISERGRNVANNIATFNGLLADYARGRFAQERRRFIQELKTKPFDTVMMKYLPKPSPAPAPAVTPARANPAAPIPVAASAPPAPISTPPVLPDSVLAKNYAKEGREYLDQERYKKAAASLSSAIRLDPSNADYYCCRGIAYAVRGSKRDDVEEMEMGLDDFKTALRLDPGHEGARRFKKTIKERLKSMEEEEEDYNLVYPQQLRNNSSSEGLSLEDALIAIGTGVVIGAILFDD